MSTKPFKYYEFDINGLLPASWQQDIFNIATNNGVKLELKSTSVTSREVSKDITTPAITVDGNVIKENLPWLYDLYRGFFRDQAQTCFEEPICVAREAVYGINLNIQTGTKMRYECHVDSNPVQGILYVTTHLQGDGGELVVSNRSESLGPEQIEKDCTKIYPKSGHLIFFDARLHPHYVTSLREDTVTRISVTMNYYTPSSPEEARPTDLTHHLFGNKEKSIV